MSGKPQSSVTESHRRFFLGGGGFGGGDGNRATGFVTDERQLRVSLENLLQRLAGGSPFDLKRLGHVLRVAGKLERAAVELESHADVTTDGFKRIRKRRPPEVDIDDRLQPARQSLRPLAFGRDGSDWRAAQLRGALGEQ